MHAERDLTRVVRSWLAEDGHESADRLLEDVLSLLDTTPQRRSWWPARRSAQMNSLAKYLIAAAAVVVIAIVGVNLLPRQGGVGGSPPSASPIASPSAAPSASSSPAASQAVTPTFPPDGAPAAGRYQMIREGVPLSFEVPATGWLSGMAMGIQKGQVTQPGSGSVTFMEDTPDDIYANPCAKKVMNPRPAHTAIGLATAIASMPGTRVVSGPEAVTVGGKPAQHVEISIRGDIGCTPHKFFLWTDERDTFGGFYATAIDTRYSVWLVDVDGSLVWINGETYKETGPATEQEIQGVIDSVRFE